MSILFDAFKLKPLQAIAVFRKKGLALSWNWFDTWKEANSQSFTVAKVTKLNVLQDIRGMIDKALSEGITFQQFKKELQPRLEKAGWWGTIEIPASDPPVQTHRDASLSPGPESPSPKTIQLGSPRRLQTIYQTNLQTSYMAGRYKSQIESGTPYLQYVAIIDGQTTDRCRGLHLKTFKSDDPIWQYMYPPNHWGCRSKVRSITERAFDRDSIVSESVDDNGQIIQKTGKLKLSSSQGRLTKRTKTVAGKPVEVMGYEMDNGGIYLPDPGWDYNPGMTNFKPDLKQYDSDIKSQFDK